MQAKAIISRYNGRCIKCKKPYSVGDKILWQKGRRGQMHWQCGQETEKPSDSGSVRATDSKQKPVENVDIPMTVSKPESGEVQTVSIDFPDLAEAWKQNAIHGNHATKKLQNQTVETHYRNRWKNDSGGFFGCKTSDMDSWLRNGYQVEGLQGIGEPSVEPSRKRRRVQFAEEGELQLDLAYSGFDYPFLEWTKRESMPGIVVNADFAFSAATNHKSIADYIRWLGRAILSIETGGVDCEIALISDWIGDGSPLNLRVIVKRENEAIDFSQFSPIFSPGGFRMLGFQQVIMSNDRVGWNCPMSLGRKREMGGEWNVQFDAEKRELKITAPYTPKSFPESDMTAKLAAALQSAKH